MIRWAIAGTGAMAGVYATELALVADAELVAVSSRTASRAQAFADEVGAGRGVTHADLMGAEDIDAVYIATPHPHHRDLAMAAIAAGKPVVVEKAFTATLAGAEEVVAAARRTGTFCMEAMWTRFQPAVVRARQLVEEGAIGEVVMVQADLGAHRAFDPDDRLFDPALGGGATLDLGVYVVSIAQHFLGRPAHVHATGTTYPNGSDASAAISMHYDDGRAASLICGFVGESPGRAVIVGTGGSIEIEPRFHHPDALVLRRNGGEVVREVHAPRIGRGYTHQIEHVSQCLRDGLAESPVMPLADTIEVMTVLQATLDQLGVRSVEGIVSL